MKPLINSINMTVEILNSKVMSTYFAEWVRLINREKKNKKYMGRSQMAS